MTLVQERDSYVFFFHEGALHMSNRLNAIGWEMNKSGYSFDGLTRDDGGGPFLFQYTLSGLGMIRIGDQLYRLDPGYAFLIQFRGNYHYYMPEESEHYECMFISLQGHDVENCWSYIKRTIGPVIYLPEYSATIRTLRNIHHEARTEKITDAFRASTLAYQFIMELYRFSKEYDVAMKLPDIVTEAAKVMQQSYDQLDSLDNLASHLGVTKSHLIKLFHRFVGRTPIEFLTRIRMEKAIELLRNNDYTLEDISYKLGYANVNYFVKVFRKFFGIPPGKFRKDHSADHILFD